MPSAKATKPGERWIPYLISASDAHVDPLAQAPLRPSQSTLSPSGFRCSGCRDDAPHYGDDRARKHPEIPRIGDFVPRAFHQQTVREAHESAHAGQQETADGDST